jgi:arginine decarboxylase
VDRANNESEASGDDVPDEFVSLAEQLSDIYYINCSIFQSLPDSWAIDQVFPVCPIHRLDEKPTRLAALADITCDSDGKIELFGDSTGKGTRSRLPLMPLREGEPYYLGVFLVGAYQEVLGDLHNLFGDTHAVHVSVDEMGGVSIDEVIDGDVVSEVLSYVGFAPKVLKRDVRTDVERAVREARLTIAEGRALLAFYEQGLDGYTYLE